MFAIDTTYCCPADAAPAGTANPNAAIANSDALTANPRDLVISLFLQRAPALCPASARKGFKLGELSGLSRVRRRRWFRR
jgi:hypothetical protein